MNIVEENAGDTLVLSLIGRIDSQTSVDFLARVHEALKDRDRLLFDFSEVLYISSAGLRVVLIAAKQIGAVKGKFALCAVKPSIYDIFKISGFTNILKIYDTRDQALAEFGGG